MTPGAACEHPYLSLALAQIPRLLSLEDREAFSKTYGCFDRTYWCWKFTDFPHPRCQEAVCSLALLWATEFADSPYYSQPKLLVWAQAGLCFWLKLQHPDGSHDEAYPYERSLAATAFTGFYIGKAVELIGSKLPPDLASALRRGLQRAGEWLCMNDEKHGFLSNHLATAAAACQVIGRVTQDRRVAGRCEYFLERIYRHQHEEGWYEEYGGADPGYQTHATYYLAEIWKHSQDERLLSSLERSMKFLQHFIHPDGSLGGEYASRNTEFYFPAGFEILAPAIPEAASIASFMRNSVEREAAVGLRTMDAFNFMPMLNNYLVAFREGKPISSGKPLFWEIGGEKLFPAAGLYVRSNTSYYAVVGISKGGVVKVYDRKGRRLKRSDCGCVAKLKSGKWVSSQRLDRGLAYEKDRHCIRLKAPFHHVSDRLFSPLLFLAFRLFTMTAGRMRRMSYFIKRQLVLALVLKKKRVPLVLERTICFGESDVRIEDKLTGKALSQVVEWQSAEKFSVVHMGSSRYFVRSELPEW